MRPGTTGATPQLCEHMLQMVKDRGYRRDPATGHWLVKTCLAPTREYFRDTCLKLVPVDSPECFACHGREFGPVTDHTIELETCHYRCTRCKRVTPGCDTQSCGHCGATVLTLLPPVINVDAYGWMLAKPPGSTA